MIYSLDRGGGNGGLRWGKEIRQSLVLLELEGWRSDGPTVLHAWSLV